MNNKTIMIIAPSAFTLGGVQTWLDYILPGLNKLGSRTVLGLISGKHHNSSKYLEVHPYDKIILISNDTGSYEGRISALIRALMKVKPDLVLSVNIVDVYPAIKEIKKRGIKIKAIATLHGIQADFLEDLTTFCDCIDTVICSNKLAQHMVRQNTEIEYERVLYAPYGVIIPTIQDPPHNETNTLTVAFVGRLEQPQKRIRDIPKILEEALRNGINMKLLVAGDGPELGWLKREISNRKLDRHVDILGTLNSSSLVSQVYQQSDVLLLTSSWETGPIVAWEAMAHGVVLISSKYVGSGKEGSLYHDENCLLFEVGDIYGAVDCLKKVQDKEKRNQIAAAARQLIEYRYSQKASIMAWNNCLNKALTLPPLNLVNKPEYIPDSASRLNIFFGRHQAEFIRKLFKRKYIHHCPGSEWPHTYSVQRNDIQSFLKIAKSLDSR